MYTTVKQFLEKYKISCTIEKNEEDILDIFNGKDIQSTDTCILYAKGLYYKYENVNEELAIQNFEFAAISNHLPSLFQLIKHYNNDKNIYPYLIAKVLKSKLLELDILIEIFDISKVCIMRDIINELKNRKDGDMLLSLARHYSKSDILRHIGIECYNAAIKSNSIDAVVELLELHIHLVRYKSHKIDTSALNKLSNLLKLEKNKTDNMYKVLGDYYKYIIKDKNRAKKYYEIINCEYEYEYEDVLEYYKNKDYEKFLVYCNKLINLGDTNAMYLLGKYYLKIGDDDKYFEWVASAIENGNENAYNEIYEQYYESQNEFDEYKTYVFFSIIDKVKYDIIKDRLEKIRDESKYFDEFLNILLEEYSTDRWKKVYEEYISKGISITGWNSTNISIYLMNKEKFLYAHSILFDTDYFKDCNSGLININCSDESIEEIIKFIYTGEFSKGLDKIFIEEIFEFSKKVSMSKLNRYSELLLKYK